MNRKFLEELGLGKEQIDKIMSENGKDVERHKSDLEQAQKERDDFKTQLDTTAAKLKDFESVDVDKLQHEIATLKGDLQQKDSVYQQQIAERDFHDTLKSKITAAHGRNVKSIMANLDIDALKESKNRNEDIEQAVNSLKESDPYLFVEEQKPVARVSTGGSHSEESSTMNTNEHMNNLIRRKE